MQLIEAALFLKFIVNFFMKKKIMKIKNNCHSNYTKNKERYENLPSQNTPGYPYKGVFKPSNTPLPNFKFSFIEIDPPYKGPKS